MRIAREGRTLLKSKRGPRILTKKKEREKSKRKEGKGEKKKKKKMVV